MCCAARPKGALCLACLVLRRSNHVLLARAAARARSCSPCTAPKSHARTRGGSISRVTSERRKRGALRSTRGKRSTCPRGSLRVTTLPAGTKCKCKCKCKCKSAGVAADRGAEEHRSPRERQNLLEQHDGLDDPRGLQRLHHLRGPGVPRRVTHCSSRLLQRQKTLLPPRPRHGGGSGGGGHLDHPADYARRSKGSVDREHPEQAARAAEHRCCPARVPCDFADQLRRGGVLGLKPRFCTCSGMLPCAADVCSLQARFGLAAAFTMLKAFVWHMPRSSSSS